MQWCDMNWIEDTEDAPGLFFLYLYFTCYKPEYSIFHSWSLYSRHQGERRALEEDQNGDWQCPKLWIEGQKMRFDRVVPCLYALRCIPSIVSLCTWIHTKYRVFMHLDAYQRLLIERETERRGGGLLLLEIESDREWRMCLGDNWG